MQLSHTVEAYNTAQTSENKIHDDDTARKFGFEGGLVPGVEVFAYMAHAPVAHWGREWLEAGDMSARFGKPVYDGRKAVVTGVVQQDKPTDLSVTIESLGQNCALGLARLDQTPAFAFALKDMPKAALPDVRPKASPESLKPGLTLGTVSLCWDAASSIAYLTDVRETLPLFEDEGVCHTGFLLRAANSALSQNVVLGPWIHVGSHIQNHSAARLDEKLEARAIVRDNYENKGHLFVELDVLIVGPDDRNIASIRHTAIYEPRQVRNAA